MAEQFAGAGFRVRVSLRLICVAAVLSMAARVLPAVTCGVVKHGSQSEADKALLAADFDRAASLYKADLDKHAGDESFTVGLVHALLRQQKVAEAADIVKTALASAPKSTAIVTLRGEVELRRGEPWLAEPTVMEAYKLDPCYPRTRLLFSRIAAVSSRYAVARQQIQLAHQFDPEDPEIRAAWIGTLPLDQRIKEMEDYLSAPRGDDRMTAAAMRADLERWKKMAGQPEHACRLVSAAASSAEIPFIKMAGWAGHTRGFGLEAGVNAASIRLDLTGGEGGLTVYRGAAERAGLKRLTENDKPGFPGAKPSYIASADTIKVGSLQFKDCAVKVIDGSSPFDDSEGSIGIDVFSDFLLTVDYPMRKLQVAPLPVRPQDQQPATPALRTDVTELSGVANAQPSDRFIAPELKDYTQVYRVGRSVIVPTALNGDKVKLFVLDVGAPETNIATDLAKQVSKTSEKEIFGRKALVADEITMNFARFTQKLNGVVGTDTSLLTRFMGMEIGGSIGANTYQKLIMHIDYRDGLVKFDYIPDRGYKF
jgi:hypothetical protein